MRIKCNGNLKIQNNLDFQTGNFITALFEIIDIIRRTSRIWKTNKQILDIKNCHVCLFTGLGLKTGFKLNSHYTHS